MKAVEPRLRYTRGRERAFLVSGRKAEIVGREALEETSGILNRNKLETYYVYREYYDVTPYLGMYHPFYKVV